MRPAFLASCLPFGAPRRVIFQPVALDELLDSGIGQRIVSYIGRKMGKVSDLMEIVLDQVVRCLPYRKRRGASEPQPNKHQR